jgi:hypothetical protein
VLFCEAITVIKQQSLHAILKTRKHHKRHRILDMRKTVFAMSGATLLMASALTFSAHAERLYCKEGKELRCLGFEQKVVSRDSICFEPEQCGRG